MAISKIKSSQIIKGITHTIINDSAAHDYAYPSGMSVSNAILIGARINTKYGSTVDALGYPDYFGTFRYWENKFEFKPKVDGNPLSITFIFAQIDY